MIRRFYILLLRLHPAAFRERFGDEMLGIFDESAERRELIGDEIVSLFRQWVLRPHAPAFSRTAVAHGAPLFYSMEPETLHAGAFLRGAAIAFLIFGAIFFTVTHRWHASPLIIGSHHPSLSHLLGAHTEATPKEELPSEIKMKPYPFALPLSKYFQQILVLAALDADQDSVISADEIRNASAALLKLDKNHDGELTAEECGLKVDSKLDTALIPQVRRMFMRVHPALAALDLNHDGVISAGEIDAASTSLLVLDRNHDGKLVEGELLPNRVFAMAAGIVATLDKNGDGKISKDEQSSEMAQPIRILLDRADREQKGYVTEEDLRNEFRRRGGKQ